MKLIGENANIDGKFLTPGERDKKNPLSNADIIDGKHNSFT